MSYYICSRNHKSVNVCINYITKQQECYRHHCNAPIKTIMFGSGVVYAESFKDTPIKVPYLKLDIE